jgi:Flp pilus assembly protein TadD/predicted Zn-dependent protease with MMP-like domain
MAPAQRRLSVAGGFVLVVGLSAAGCTRRPAPAAAPAATVPASGAPAALSSSSGGGTGTGALTGAGSTAEDDGIRPLRRCFSELPPWIDPPVADVLDQAGRFLDDEDFEGLLACTEEAARQMPRSVEAHHGRALALMRLGRLDAARDALALALAIAPTDGECLELAAELFVNRLPPTAERTAIGLEYARRGRRVVGGKDRRPAARLALLEGQALVDLGRSSEALRPLAAAIKLDPTDASARYEQGVALFELCRFDAARSAFTDVLVVEPKHAHALYHLALIDERDGREAEARRRFEEASEKDPRSFPPTPEVSAEDFDHRLRQAVARLPADLRADLQTIPVQAAELPAIEDLTAERPPLSPTILGLYRGLPLGREPVAQTDGQGAAPASRAARGRPARPAGSGGAAADGAVASCAVPARAIVIYRRNILRSVHRIDELDSAIERTLLHEIGHLRGEDDGSLRDRGLE